MERIYESRYPNNAEWDVDPKDQTPGGELTKCAANRNLWTKSVLYFTKLLKLPPTPIFVPNAQANAPIARNFGLSLSVVISLTITTVNARQPPPPRPCTTRAAMSQFMFWAVAQRILPKRKRKFANMMIHFRPLGWLAKILWSGGEGWDFTYKISEIVPYIGIVTYYIVSSCFKQELLFWGHTVCANKYDVPTQKASRLVPFNDTAMAGRVEATITASIATITEIRQSIKIVSLNLKDFLSSAGTAVDGSRLVESTSSLVFSVVWSPTLWRISELDDISVWGFFILAINFTSWKTIGKEQVHVSCWYTHKEDNMSFFLNRGWH